MKLLLLGGTADARQLAQALQQRGVEVIYSIAGLVRQPQLECRVLSGGFSAYGGLQPFVARAAIDAILDATHPYAQRMSATALAVARAQGIPLWRYQRPPWQAQAGDDWHSFDDWSELPPLLRAKRSVFFTAGQLTQAFVEQLQAHCAAGGQRQILRTAIQPEIELPESMTWIEDIGPFDIACERDLFERYRVDALVSKNSGGAATAAKLEVARERGVPVFLLRRPPLPAADVEFSEAGHCLDFIAAQALVSACAMPVDFETDPAAIERESFRQIRALTDLDGLDAAEQQVAMRIVHSLGLPEVVASLRFSAGACAAGIVALRQECPILCDVEMVRHGVTRRMREVEPLCFLNDARVPALARERGETRSMAALELWQPLLAGSLVLIGNAPTALFRLLQMLEAGAAKPALIVAMPVGFVGAAESKQLLWDTHRQLGVECITLIGRQGGSAVTAASCNALLRCIRDEWY